VRQMFGCVPVVVQSVSAEHAFITHMPDASPVPQEVSVIMDEQSASALQEGWQTLPIFVLQISLVPPQSPLLWHDVGELGGGAEQRPVTGSHVPPPQLLSSVHAGAHLAEG